MSVKTQAQKTARAYKQSINEYRDYLRDHKKKSFLALELSDFSRDNIYDFLVYLWGTKGLKASTLNFRLSVLKSFMGYCGDEDPEVTMYYLSLSRILNFKDPERTGSVGYLTEDQLQQLFGIPDVSLNRAGVMIFL